MGLELIFLWNEIPYLPVVSSNASLLGSGKERGFSPFNTYVLSVRISHSAGALHRATAKPASILTMAFGHLINSFKQHTFQSNFTKFA